MIRLKAAWFSWPELRDELTGPTGLEIEFHLLDIPATAVAPGKRINLIESLEFFVALMLEQFLKLLLGHHFVLVQLQFGQSRVELPANDLSLSMVGTMKAE